MSHQLVEKKPQEKNQLFNDSVIGGTVEDYSQNVILLPAQNVTTRDPCANDPNGSPLITNAEQEVIQAEHYSIQQHPKKQVASVAPTILPFGNTADSECVPITDYRQTTCTSSISDTKGISQNVYGYSTGTNKLPYDQIPSQIPQSVQSIDDHSSKSNPSVKAPFTSSQPHIGSIAHSHQPETTTSSTKPPQFNPASIYAFRFDHTGQNDFSIALAISNPPAPFLYSANVASHKTNPCDLGTESTRGTQGTLIMDTHDERNGAVLHNKPDPVSKCKPVNHHWFIKKETEGRVHWQPFSMVDSLAIEQAFLSKDANRSNLVPTHGGRFDVNLLRREQCSIYWNSLPHEVRRCSWFYKEHNDVHFLPFEENISTMLEQEYTHALEANTWNRKIELSNRECLIMIAPDVLLLFSTAPILDPWVNDTQASPRVVRRGMDEFNIDQGESERIDHLMFIVHGIGSVCDLKFRSVEQVVDDFRSIASQLLNSHYQTACNNGSVNRIEVLPISWHSKLHSEETGIDKKLKSITLSRIPRLRDFTNDTLLDILLYTSPKYFQTIITSVGDEINRVFEIFKTRNPSFQGGVSLGGHSLGSLILFDLLCHQNVDVDIITKENDSHQCSDTPDVKMVIENQSLSYRLSNLVLESSSSPQRLQFPHLLFQPTALFAIGSPIGMFLTIRGLDKLGDKFALPTCPRFLNIFHPYDPVAYRIESLINPQLAKLKPVLIPHHKGRKRMHLQLKDTMSRVGADLKQKLIDSMKTTWNTLFQMGFIDKQHNEEKGLVSNKETNEQADAKEIHIDEHNSKAYLGRLNNGRRIDYVLQEAPFEVFNEYVFSLTSHVCYWESEDTILIVLNEIYNSMGIPPDVEILEAQQGASSDVCKNLPDARRLNQCASGTLDEAVQIGMDPTIPINPITNLGPPPVAGFFRSASS